MFVNPMDNSRDNLGSPFKLWDVYQTDDAHTLTGSVGTSSPVVTWTGSSLPFGTVVSFDISTSLPSGGQLVVATPYYVVNPSANTFDVSDVVGGPPIIPTGSAISGTVHIYRNPQFTLTTSLPSLPVGPTKTAAATFSVSSTGSPLVVTVASNLPADGTPVAFQTTGQLPATNLAYPIGSGTGYISGTVLIISAASVANFIVGDMILGAGITAGTILTGPLTNTAGVGTWSVSISQTAGSVGSQIAITSARPLSLNTLYTTTAKVGTVGSSGTFQLVGVNGVSGATAGSGTHTMISNPLKFVPHPCTRVSASGCTGGFQVVDLCAGPQNAPLFSYSKRKLSGFFGTLGGQLDPYVWGTLDPVVGITVKIIRPGVVGRLA
jgi:hypothetical protein